MMTVRVYIIMKSSSSMGEFKSSSLLFPPLEVSPLVLQTYRGSVRSKVEMVQNPFPLPHTELLDPLQQLFCFLDTPDVFQRRTVHEGVPASNDKPSRVSLYARKGGIKQEES